MAFLNLCIFLTFLHQAWTDQTRGLQDGVSQGGREQNPGFKMRATQAAMNYVESLALKALTQEITRVRINDVRGEIQGGDVHMYNMRITSYKPPTSHSVTLEPPDLVRWTTRGADMHMMGSYDSRVHGLLLKVPMAGEFEGDARQVDFSISFSFFKADDGGLMVKSRQCTTNIGSLTAKLKNHIQSPGAAFLLLFKNVLVQRIKPIIAAEMCEEAKRFVDDELNKQLSTMPRKIPLNQTNYDRKQKDDQQNNRLTDNNGQANKKAGKNGLRDLADTVSKSLVLDYSMMNNPMVNQKYIESWNLGEVSYEGQGGTPFDPIDLQDPNPPPTDRMLYIIASDYVVNSLFWHAYKHGMLNFHANGKENPEYKDLLRTSCDDDVFGICLGNLVPEVSKSYPNSQAEIAFQCVKSPAVYFRKDGTVRFVAPSHVVAYATKKRNELREMLTADVNVEGTMSIWIEDNYIKGNGTITTFRMTMRKNNLPEFTQDKLNEFSKMARSMFQDIANKELMKGLPLPTADGVRLINPNVRFFERTAMIETDLEIDDTVIDYLTQEALRNGNSRFTLDRGR